MQTAEHPFPAQLALYRRFDVLQRAGVMIRTAAALAALPPGATHDPAIIARAIEAEAAGLPLPATPLPTGFGP